MTAYFTMAVFVLHENLYVKFLMLLPTAQFLFSSRLLRPSLYFHIFTVNIKPVTSVCTVRYASPSIPTVESRQNQAPRHFPDPLVPLPTLKIHSRGFHNTSSSDLSWAIFHYEVCRSLLSTRSILRLSDDLLGHVHHELIFQLFIPKPRSPWLPGFLPWT